MSIWPIRSMLFIPGHKLEWVRTVQRFAPDAVVLDLEDAVPHDLKAGARATVREAIPLLVERRIAAFVRINDFESGGEDDVAAIGVPGLAGIMLPKADSAKQVQHLDRLLAHAEGRSGMALGTVGIIPLPETARGLADARLLAEASNRVTGLVTVVGGPVAGDVARAAGIEPSDMGIEQQYLWSKIALDSRAAGALFPLSSIIGTRLDDLDAVRRLVRLGKSFGYTGAVLIHPSHVAAANEAYTPTREEALYHRDLVAAIRDAERAGLAAVNFRGRMVDYAMRPHSESIVREAVRRNVLAAEATGQSGSKE